VLAGQPDRRLLQRLGQLPPPRLGAAKLIQLVLKLCDWLRNHCCAHAVRPPPLIGGSTSLTGRASRGHARSPKTHDPQQRTSHCAVWPAAGCPYRFETMSKAAEDEKIWNLFPPLYQEELGEAGANALLQKRIVVEYVANMTEHELARIYVALTRSPWVLSDYLTIKFSRGTLRPMTSAREHRSEVLAASDPASQQIRATHA
jgi:hypothetical protein